MDLVFELLGLFKLLQDNVTYISKLLRFRRKNWGTVSSDIFFQTRDMIKIVKKNFLHIFFTNFGFSSKYFFYISYHISSLDKNIWAYSTSFFASEPQQFADISDIVIWQFLESQELKNSVLFFFTHTLFEKMCLNFEGFPFSLLTKYKDFHWLCWFSFENQNRFRY